LEFIKQLMESIKQLIINLIVVNEWDK